MFDALAIRELRLSDGALREGVLYEMEGRFRHQDVRSRTASSLANQYHIDSEQARRVLDTTMQMYEPVAGTATEAGASATGGATAMGRHAA